MLGSTETTEDVVIETESVKLVIKNNTFNRELVRDLKCIMEIDPELEFIDIITEEIKLELLKYNIDKFTKNIKENTDGLSKDNTKSNG